MLKGAVIGVGKIAQECHLPAFKQENIAGRAKIIAAVDLNQKSLDQAKKIFPDIIYFNSLDSLFENDEYDFIDICTPPALHFQTIKDSIGRNLNIICEKPFTLKLSEAKEIYGLLCQSPLTFIPCHQYRYSPIWKRFKEYIKESDPEDHFFLQFNVFRTEADKGLPVLNNIWRTDPEISGGGILSDTGVHYLYLCLWMLGSPVSITARTFNFKYKSSNVEDTAAIILESGRSVIQINLSWASDRRANSARLISSRGSLVYDGRSLYEYKDNKVNEIPVPDASDKSNYVTMYAELFENFISLAEQSNKDDLMLSEAYQTVKLLDLCYRSACDKKTVEFDAE